VLRATRPPLIVTSGHRHGYTKTGRQEAMLVPKETFERCKQYCIRQLKHNPMVAIHFAIELIALHTRAVQQGESVYKYIDDADKSWLSTLETLFFTQPTQSYYIRTNDSRGSGHQTLRKTRPQHCAIRTGRVFWNRLTQMLCTPSPHSSQPSCVFNASDASHTPTMDVRFHHFVYLLHKVLRTFHPRYVCNRRIACGLNAQELSSGLGCLLGH